MSDATLQQISVDAIAPSPHNPRRFRKDDAELASLADSIRAKGVLQPILVRPLPDPLNTDKVPQFELIAGERRWRASRAAERSTIPAIVREGLTDQEALELTVLENLQREDLSPLEEASGVASLLAGGKPLAEVADQLGKPLSWVARRSRIASLSPNWQKLAGDPKSGVSTWSASVLEIVARLEPTAQDALLKDDPWIVDRPESVRRIAAQHVMELRLAPWKADDATLLPAAGACSCCPKRSSVNPGLFEEDEMAAKQGVAPKDRCLDSVCWQKKDDVVLEQKARDLSTKHERLVLAGDKHDGGLPAFAKGAALVNPYEGREAKKGESGAVPVLQVNGHNRGRLSWRVFGKGKTPRPAGEKPTPKPMAERRAMLAQRRQAWMLKAVCGRLTMTPIPETAILLQLLVLAGTMHNHSRPDACWLKKLPANPERDLFDSVVSVLTHRWEYTLRWQGTKGMKNAWAEIEQIAGMVSMDLSSFEADAEMAIPEPKSWAKAAVAKSKKAAPAKKQAIF